MADKDIRRADHYGTMTIGDVSVECYVLNDETRGIGRRGVVELISGTKDGNLSRYLSRIPLEDNTLDLRPIHFYARGGMGYLYRAEDIWMILEAYDHAWEQGLLRADQIPIAKRCRALMRTWGRVGLDAAIDEVTGYQRLREVDALQVKINAYMRDELRLYEPTYPEAIWREMFRLDGKPYHASKRPQHFGKKILTYIYDAMDLEVSREMKRRIPDPHYGENLHQLLTDFGLRRLHTQIEVFYKFLESSTSWDDFEHRWEMIGPHGQFGLDLGNEPDPISV